MILQHTEDGGGGGLIFTKYSILKNYSPPVAASATIFYTGKIAPSFLCLTSMNESALLKILNHFESKPRTSR